MDLLGYVDHGYVTLPPPPFFNGPTDTPQRHIYSTTLIYSVRVPVPPYLECHIQINVNMFCCWWLAQPVTMATAQPPLLRHPSYLRLPHGFFHQGHHDHCTYVQTCHQTCWQIAVGGEGGGLNVDDNLKWDESEMGQMRANLRIRGDKAACVRRKYIWTVELRNDGGGELKQKRISHHHKSHHKIRMQHIWITLTSINRFSF